MATLSQELKDPTVPVNQNVAKLCLYLLGYEAGVGDRGERVGDGDEGEQVVGRDRVRQLPVTQSWNNIEIKTSSQ
jgi:hypothetical protein